MSLQISKLNTSWEQLDGIIDAVCKKSENGLEGPAGIKLMLHVKVEQEECMDVAPDSILGQHYFQQH